MSPDVICLLEEEASRINSPAFIADDPVQFPRRFESLPDIEIAALLTAVISWGRRPMILRDADRMMALMDHQPHKYVMERGYEDLDPSINLHRTFFARDFIWFLRALREVYSKYESLNDFALAVGCKESETPSWLLAEKLGSIACDVNGGCNCAQCLPTNIRTTALKRINMALRWLVRNDGIVDMGVWNAITPAQLYIPLDVHVGNVSRQLGLLQRKANDRRSTEELTALLRTIRPDDPVLFDYALFGLGVSGAELKI